MPTIKNARIAVIGGGLAGLSFANAAQFNQLTNVTVYEQAKEFREIGAGISLSENAYRCLDQYGLKEPLMRMCNEQSDVNSIEYGRWFRHYKTGEEMAVVQPYGKPNRRIHRAHLLDILRSKLPKEMLKTNKRLLKIEEKIDNEKEYVLHFADGTTATADIIIGCDGIHSNVRKYLGILDNAQYSGKVVYRGLLPPSSLPKEATDVLRLHLTFFRGYQSYIAVYPIGQKEHCLYNVAAFMSEPLSDWHSESWMSKAPVKYLQQHVKDWCPCIQSIVEALENTSEGGEIMKQALHVRAPTDKWYEGGVVLLGDSVHSTLPHQGQGCCMAVESAAALAVLLKNAKETDTPEIVFEKYKALRKPRTDRMTETSAIAGHTILSADPNSIEPDNFTQEKIEHNWYWIETYNVLEAVEDMLQVCPTSGE